MSWIGFMTDDGPTAPGFGRLVAELLSAGWQVEAVAPKEGWCNHGTGAGNNSAKLGVAQPLHLDGTELTVDVFDAPPGAVAKELCIRAHRKRAIHGPPVCIVAGVNHGPNVGGNLIHSGTFGGALVASWLGFSAVAVSLDDVFSVDERNPGPLRYCEAARVGRLAIGWLLNRRRTLLCNINVPNSLRSEDLRVEAATPHEKAHSRVSLQQDTEVLKNGHVAISVFPNRSLCASQSLSLQAAAAITHTWFRE